MYAYTRAACQTTTERERITANSYIISSSTSIGLPTVPPQSYKPPTIAMKATADPRMSRCTGGGSMCGNLMCVSSKVNKQFLIFLSSTVFFSLRRMRHTRRLESSDVKLISSQSVGQSIGLPLERVKACVGREPPLDPWMLTEDTRNWYQWPGVTSLITADVPVVYSQQNNQCCHYIKTQDRTIKTMKTQGQCFSANF